MAAPVLPAQPDHVVLANFDVQNPPVPVPAAEAPEEPANVQPAKVICLCLCFSVLFLFYIQLHLFAVVFYCLFVSQPLLFSFYVLSSF